VEAVSIVIGVGWLSFWIYWLAAATRVKGTRPDASETRWQLQLGLRVVIVLVILILLRLRIFRVRAIPHAPALLAIGLLLFVAGLALAVWARLHIGRNWGLPMSEKADPELITNGPYHLIRHPIYSGLILAMLGTALAISLYWLIVAPIVGGYFIYSARTEERYMTELFPDAYPAYKSHTKMLIPFLV